MTGPEHFEKAEMLIGQAQELSRNDHDRAVLAASAQVHATLALAAATAMAAHSEDGMAPADFNAWDKVCGEVTR